MSNNKLPKEIYLLGQDLEFMVEDGKKDLYHIDASLSDILSNQKVYLLKQSVDERIDTLEDIIVQNNADNRRREQLLEQTIKDKEKEIKDLLYLTNHLNGKIDGLIKHFGITTEQLIDMLSTGK